MTQAQLPINAVLEDLVRSVCDDRSVVLKAPPGAGKTTGVPLVLLDAIGQGEIILVQPRRLAARSAAARLAKLRGCRLGDEVGYHVRFDRKVSSSTRLTAMTTGILLRRLQSDPLLEDVACVILDEFHERSLDIDLALGMLHRVRQTLRDDLKLIVMSATLDPQPIVDFLGDAEAITSEGKSYPVDIRYARETTASSGRHEIPIQQRVAQALPEILDESAGHVLVFLPGVGEIKRTDAAIRECGLNRQFELHQLYGDLSPSDQDRVIAESDIRKVILSTNVAETSVTIPGVTAVIDSGLARVMKFDDKVGLPKLELDRISKASADQRAGRAGRTEPGVCLRLWASAVHRSLSEADVPEILRTDFSGALLTLAAWGERDALDFPWLTSPRDEAVQRSTELLQSISAMSADKSITPLGQRMVALPLHPRLARFLVEASRLGVVDEGTIAAALLTERDPFRGQVSLSRPGTCDVENRIDSIRTFDAARGDRSINGAAARNILRVAKQLRRNISATEQVRHDEGNDDESPGDQPGDEHALQRCLLTAYPDRVARRRSDDPHRGRMVSGRGVQIDRSSVAFHRPSEQTGQAELFLALSVDSKGTEARTRLASCVDIEWISSDQIRTVDEAFFNPQSQSVAMRRRKHIGELTLSETPIQCERDESTAEILFEHAKESLSDLFPLRKSSVSSLVARVNFLCDHLSDSKLQPIDNDALQDLLRQLCHGRISFAELKSAPWMDHLVGRYDYQQMQLIDRQAPSRMQVPSGNTHAIEYQSGKSPLMKVKIQELFGLAETPRLAGGQVPLQLHLLGPNRRTQQITDDLANFWKTTYTAVRKDLRGRYPKHYWPEDPTKATATRNGLKPRK